MNISRTMASAILLLLLVFSLCCHPASNSSGQTNRNDAARTAQSTDAGPVPESVYKSKMPTADRPYIKVYVTKSGEITLDGKAATLAEVGSAFSGLAQKKGVVVYTREAPEEYEPHPNASKVIELVIENQLPIRMCLNKDFSDAIGPDGKLLAGK